MKPETVYLDMDGVLADFEGMALKYVGFTGADFKNLDRAQMSGVQIHQQQELFNAIDSHPEMFIEEKPYYFSRELYHICQDRFNAVKILSKYKAPAWDKGLFETVRKYKTDWIKLHIDASLPDSDIIITDKSKGLYAQPEHYLIDDMVVNIREWEQARGRGILFTDYNTVKAQLLQRGKVR